MSADLEPPSSIIEGEEIDLGNFYPTHHVVLAFDQRSQADDAEETIRRAGFRDIRLVSDRQMRSALQHGRNSVPALPATGTSTKSVQLCQQLAEQGCQFLIVRAPSEDETQTLMNILQQHPCRLAQKYHRLVIQTLQ